MGFCTEEQAKRFLDEVPSVEKAIVEWGVMLLKYWLRSAPTSRRNGSRHASTTGGRSGSFRRWISKLRRAPDDYSKARLMYVLVMHRAGTCKAARSDVKRCAQLNNPPPSEQDPLQEGTARERRKLPKRHVAASRKQTDYSYKLVPEVH